jgi:RNA polymerase sigma factor (sigma-70 family)
MATRRAELVLRHLRTVLSRPITEPRSDRELLRRFAQQRDEEAFAELVRRHGPMVLAVCRHVLPNPHDADDAFQAAFLVLARKAKGRGWHESVGNWLYLVAYRLALRVREQARRRKQHEARAAGTTPVDPLEAVSGRELCAALDEELSRLPERYRAAIVACCLEGQARDEAARALGWSPRMLKRRLERGRGLLRTRLEKRGFALPAALAGALIAEGVSPAAIPAALTRATMIAAATGREASARALGLAQAFLRGPMVSSFRAVAAVVLAASLIGGLGLAFGLQSQLVGWAESSKPNTDPVGLEDSAHPTKENKTDRHGDPLPPGAVARLGTVRFRCWADSVAFLPGDKVLATVAREAVSFWDARTGKEKQCTVDMHWGEAFALSADGKLLAVAADPNNNAVDLHLWEVDTGKHLRHFTGHQGRVHALAFAADGRTLASVGGRQVWVWDTATGKEVWRADVGPADLAIAISPDGKLLASAGWDVASAVSIRETATGKELHHYRLPLGVPQVVFAPDGKTLAAVEDWNDDDDGPRENKVHLWDLATGKLKRQLPLRGHILCVAFSPESKALATGHLDTFHVWDVATGKWIERFEGHSGRTNNVAFSGDGKTLATSGDSTIRLWDVATGKACPSQGDGHRGPVHALAYLADGKTLVTAGDDHTLRHWDTASGREIRRFPGMGSVVFAPCFAGASNVLALPIGNEVRLCEPATGKELRRFRYPDHVRQVALTPDGKTLAVYAGGKDLTLRLVDAATGKERLARRDAGHIQSMAFSPGGEVLALGPQDPVLLLLDAATGSEIYKQRPTENVTNLTFSPDGKTLAGGAGYGTLRFWEVATGKERAQWPDRDLRSGSAMAFSPDGRLLALGDADGKIRLVSAATGNELKQLRGHRSGITSLAFATDGKTLASGSWDTTVLVWDVCGIGERKEEPPAAVGAGQLAALWANLASDDAAKAYRSIQDLIAASRQSVPFLAQRMQPRAPVTAERITQLIAELDNERFEAREEAAAALAGLEKRAEPLLRKTLAKDPSLEVRRRIESLLGKLQGPVTFAETLRALRTIEVLEHIATPEARQLLQKLASGAPDARLTRDAKAALKRLQR